MPLPVDIDRRQTASARKVRTGRSGHAARRGPVSAAPQRRIPHVRSEYGRLTNLLGGSKFNLTADFADCLLSDNSVA